MWQTPGNVSLVESLFNMESQAIINRGREQDQQKQAQQMQQQQQTQQTIQQILAKQSLQQQPVTNEISSKLMQMSAYQKEQEQVKEWEKKFQTNMQIAEALAPTDHVAAAEYRKEALGYKSMAKNAATEAMAEKKDKARDEGAILNVMWQSPEGYATGMENLRQVSPELAAKLEKKYPNGLTLGAAREISAEANSRMSIEQQQSKALAVEKVIADKEHKEEMERQGRERLAEQKSRDAQNREDKLARRAETKTKEERQNAAYVKTENALIKEYDNDYDNLDKEYRKAKFIFDKEGRAIDGVDTKETEAMRSRIQEIVDDMAKLSRSHLIQLEKTKADAIAQGATHPRLFQESKPATNVAPKTNHAYTSTVAGKTPEQIISTLKSANNWSDEEALKYAKEHKYLK